MTGDGVSSGGERLRPDGRAPHAHRPLTVRRGFLLHAEGSVLVTHGHTRLICAASLSQALPEFRRGTGGGWITAEYAMLPRSTKVRSPRQGVNRRAAEISRFLGRCLRAVVDLDALGPWLVQVDCDVVDADAGTRCAALTGGFVALRDALSVLSSREGWCTDPVREPVAAVSVAHVAGRLVVDPCYEEDQHASIDLTVALTPSGRLVEVHAASESVPYDRDTLDRMIGLAFEVAPMVFAAQRAAWEDAADGRDRVGQP